MGELPTGTVTFLLTDIERSTESAIALGDQSYAELLQIHRRLLRTVFEAAGGLEFAMEGDALFVAFARPTEAMDAAINGQRALEVHDWPGGTRIRVRMGVHTGEAVISQGEYVGQHIHRAKRICDAGHGSQILLSEATVALLPGELPDDVTLVDLGQHQLKDLGAPQHIYQLAVDDLPTDFPSLRSLETFTHNLPLPRSAFVGREHEIADVRKLLERHRLVTLTGIGGCGKTRLALQVGAEELDSFPDGVFLIELAPLTDADLITRGVADAIGMLIGGGLTGGTSVPVADLVAEHLARRRCLLIFDNCEHLLRGSAAIVDRILARCPNVTILATSREALGVDGEQSWPVPSLSVSTEGSMAEQSESVRLFAVRAQAVQPSFELSADNLDAVNEICARMDGLPLAIELAASRVTHLSPIQIAARLDDMFRLLTGGRGQAQRQQTLQASLDWSYELLDESDRVLLRRLAVFAGTFGLDAAEEICADEQVARESVIDVLRSLVDKSLVRTAGNGSETRYRLLEPVRIYAAERLRQADEAERFRERHRDRYLGWVDAFPPDEATFGFAAYRAFDKEHDNLRAALEWSDAQGRYDLVARLANGLLALWWNGGYYDEGQRWLTTAIERAELSDDLSVDDLVRAYVGLTVCSIMRVDARARDYAALALDNGGDDPTPYLVIALGLGAIFSGVIAELTRDPNLAMESRDWTSRAIQIGTDSGPAWKAFAHVVAGQSELVLRDLAAADRHARAALDAWRVPSLSVVACAATLAVTRHIIGDAPGALEAARIAAEVEEEWWRPGLGANSLGLALAGVGEFEEANRYLSDSVRNATNWGVGLWLNEALVFSGAAAFLAGHAERASRLLAAGRHLGGAPQLATPFRTGHSYALYLHYVPLVRDALGPGGAHRTRAEGRAMSIDEVTAYAVEGFDG